MYPAEIEEMLARLREFLEPVDGGWPMFAGAVVLAGRVGRARHRDDAGGAESRDELLVHEAMGHALRYADADGTELPRDRWVPMRRDSVFDLASVTKLFTSIVVVQQVEQGRLDLDAPVVRYLPAFGAAGKTDVTVRHLLTHTSGLPAWAPLWRYGPDRAARVRRALEVAPDGPPGARYTYSDLNLIALGALAEHVSGERLDVLVRTGITEPLGMTDTGFGPVAAVPDRVAATEIQHDPPRGLVRGEVHDENAWSMAGVAGHAGLFSTALDLARLCRALLHGGALDGGRILAPESVDLMLADGNPAFPDHAHGLGFELGQRWFMGALASPRTAGHTGFTGTSLVIDLDSGAYTILLTNRVHPSRAWSGVNAARRLVADTVARVVGVRARSDPTRWCAARPGPHGGSPEAGARSGAGSPDDAGSPETVTGCDAGSHPTGSHPTGALSTGVPSTDGVSTGPTMTLAATLRTTRTRLAFEMFVGDETGDLVVVELSRDDGATWTPVPVACRSRGKVAATDGALASFAGRRWQQVFAELDEEPGPVLLRWRYLPGGRSSSPGLLVEDVRLADAAGRLVVAPVGTTGRT